MFEKPDLSFIRSFIHPFLPSVLACQSFLSLFYPFIFTALHLLNILVAICTPDALITMFFQGEKLATALTAVAFASNAILSSAASLGRPAHGIQHARSLRPAGEARFYGKRADAACAASTLNVEQLQEEYSTFHGWLNTWLQTAVQEDAATAVAQLKQEFSSYDTWMNTWLQSALNGSSSAGPTGSAPSVAPVSSVPLPVSTSIASSQGLTLPVGSSSSFVSVAPFPTASLSQGPSGVGSPSSGVASGSGAPTGIAPTGTAPIASSSAVASSTGNSTIGVPSSTPSSPAGSGSFNAKAKDNVVVYYGQSGATSSVKLTDLCSDKDVDVVILSFLTTFAGPGGYPTVNFGAACGGAASPAATAKGATGLLSCPDLGKDIQTCQAAGKKVFLSLGGAEAESAFTSDDQATKFATQLWNLFGAGTGEDAGLRPFGAGVSVDGFDIGKSIICGRCFPSRSLSSISEFRRDHWPHLDHAMGDLHHPKQL